MNKVKIFRYFYAMIEDNLDLALIKKRRRESNRPFRDYLAERKKRGG